MHESRFNDREFPFLVLPLPPTDNRLRMPVKVKGQVRLILTPEYRDWKKELEITWMQWAGENRDFRPYEVSANFFLSFGYEIYLGSWAKDAQNHEKALRDGLEGLLFTNDRYVFIQATKKPQIDKLNPRIVLDTNPTLL